MGPGARRRALEIRRAGLVAVAELQREDLAGLFRELGDSLAPAERAVGWILRLRRSPFPFVLVARLVFGLLRRRIRSRAERRRSPGAGASP